MSNKITRDELIYAALTMSDWNKIIAAASTHAARTAQTAPEASSELFKAISDLHAQAHHKELRANE